MRFPKPDSSQVTEAFRSGPWPLVFWYFFVGTAGVLLGLFARMQTPLLEWQMALPLLGGAGLCLSACALLLKTTFVPHERFIVVVFLLAVAIRALALPQEPNTDVYRYLWEGKIQLEGFNPYIYAPNDEVLAHLRGHLHSQVNNPSFSAAYGPLAQLLFRGLATLGASVMAWKTLVVAADLAVLALIVRWLKQEGQPALWSTLYALHPLVIISFAGEGHLDVFVLLFLVGGVSALRRRHETAAGVLVGAAMLVKITAAPFLLLLALPRPRPRALASAATCFVVGHAPYATAGVDLYTSVARFGLGRFNDLPRALMGDDMNRIILNTLAIVVATTVGLVLAKRQVGTLESAAVVAVTFIALSPTVHPWYATIVVPWVALSWSAAAWTLSLTMLVGFHTSAVAATTGTWVEPPSQRVWVFAPFLLVLSLSLTRFVWERRLERLKQQHQ